MGLQALFPEELAMSRILFRFRLPIAVAAVVGTMFVSDSLMSPVPARADYTDPNQPIAARVTDLLGRMSLDEKLGQMTQVDRTALASPSDLTTFRIGSVLSGGGSA